MKKIHIILIAIVLLAGILSANQKDFGKCPNDGQGMDKRFDKHHDRGMGMFQMAEELELTDTQIEKFEEIKLEHEKYMIKIKSEIEILQLDKKAALKDKNFAEAKKITETIFEKKQKAAFKMIDLHEEKWNTLTDEQKKKADELKRSKKHCPEKMPEGKGKKHNM